MMSKKSVRFRQMICLAGSTALISSCHPWLASRGETHSPYQPQKQPTQAQSASNGKTPATGVSIKPSVTPSPSPSPTPIIQRPDAERSLNIGESDHLQIQFLQDDIIQMNVKNAPPFDDYGCRELVLQRASWDTTPPRENEFSCRVQYCVRRPGTGHNTGYDFAMEKRDTYVLNQADYTEDTQGNPQIIFERAAGKSRSGYLARLICNARKGQSFTVGDLLDAFSGGGKNPDNVDIRVISDPIQKRNPASTELPQQSMQSDESRNAHDYEYESRPSFGIQLMGSAGAFGNSTISPAQQGIKSGAFLVQLEYEPKFLQSLGIFSIGPSAGAYPTLGTSPAGQSVTGNALSIREFGAQARYQFHYWNEQFLVPYVSYEAQNVHYNIKEGGTGSLTIAGGSAGVGLLLNRLASGEASSFHESFGVARSYLVVEGKNLSGSDQNVKVSGTSVYFGLRFER